MALRNGFTWEARIMSKGTTSLLLIMDGFGFRAEREGNAVALANTPNFDYLWSKCPHTLLTASGLAVGLPAGQMGNSEVGHLHIGAGRLVMQELTRIDTAVDDGEFARNAVLNDMIDQVLASGKRLHVMGLLSDGGVHSHIKHWQAMLELAAKRGVQQLSLHLFLDGRDTPPQSAEKYIQTILEDSKRLGCGQLASISGRFYAMDRDKRWDRIERTYDMMVGGVTPYRYADALEGLQESYKRGEFDEFVQPTIVQGTHPEDFNPICDGDWVMFMNFRADRARELCTALTDSNFNAFTPKQRVQLGGLVTLTSYADNLAAKVAFPPQQLRDTLGEVVAARGLRQLRLAETEKYAHVTYFVNGGREESWDNEERILVPSPKVATYDLQPEMSALEVSKKLLEALDSGKYRLIICNFANPDMVGHTGKLPETIRAIEFLDEQLGKLLAKLQEVDGDMLLIADHGNAEVMVDPSTGKPHTAHTTNPVPCIYYGRRKMRIKEDRGVTGERSLVDVAPTMLYLMGIEIPSQMRGVSLLELDE